MSRCFPYPPPGYTLSRDRKEDLVESIKLQKDRKKSKERKKDKGTEKQRRHKEERNDNKNKNYEKRNPMSEKSDIPNGLTGKDICGKNEQLEKSNLTEEHKGPIFLPAPSISSDSTDNSNKRKRTISLVNGNCGVGTILKILLPSKKLKSSDTSVTEQNCSTSGRTDFLIPEKVQHDLKNRQEKVQHDLKNRQEKVELDLKNRQENRRCQSAETSKLAVGFTFSTNKELSSATSQNIDVTPARKGTSSVLHSSGAANQKAECLQYKNVIENWVPAQLNNTLCDPENLDWLLSSKIQKKPSEKRQKSGCDIMLCSRGSLSWQPQVHYLPEADVFALPYAIPF